MSGDGRHLGGRGQEVADCVEQRLHALVAQGRASQHGNDLAGEGALAQGRHQRGRLDRLALEIRGRDAVVEIGGRFHQFVARGGHGLGHGQRHAVFARRIVFCAREEDGPFANQIHHPGELILGADR